jgi:hypothetical protein
MPNGWTSGTAGAPPCLWRKGIVRANNTATDTANRALFETNFCHPYKTNEFETAYDTCIGFNDEQSCEQNQCSWSTMQEFLPPAAQIDTMPEPRQYCLPADIPMNQDAFGACTQHNTTATCAAPCRMFNMNNYRNINLPAPENNTATCDVHTMAIPSNMNCSNPHWNNQSCSW